MQAQPTSNAAPKEPANNKRVREEKNRQFANDGSYESVQRLLLNIAARCFSRAQAMGIGMTLDDVLQEMNLTYVMAKERWNPDGGALFSTYLTTACYYNFNDRIRRAETERRHLGLVNLTDMKKSNGAGDDMDDCDLMELHDVGDQEHYNVVHLYGNNLIEGAISGDMEAPMNADPAVLHEQMQGILMDQALASEKLRNLTEPAKRVVAELLLSARNRQDQNAKLPKLGSILKAKGLSEAESRRVRREIVAAFGVKV